ncbi:MAG TPA: hypothetical protein VFO55_10335 [Gemmatimonadaceae bacterium]|nr:hypothetical protein [Gemmatimonadaceae bacterium]
MRAIPIRPAIRAGGFALLLAIAVACAARDPGTGTTPRRDSSIMDTTDLRSHDYSTVYDAISRQHADWLFPRGGPVGGQRPVLGVWIEGNMRSMGVDYLRTLRPVDVRQVRRLSTTESLHTYSWPWGGLVITLR